MDMRIKGKFLKAADLDGVAHPVATGHADQVGASVDVSVLDVGEPGGSGAGPVRAGRLAPVAPQGPPVR